MTAQRPPVPRIVVGVDGSRPAAAALRWALAHALLTSASVDAIIAWQDPGQRGLGLPAPAAAAACDYERLAARILDGSLTREVPDGCAVTIRRLVVRDDPALALVEAAIGASLLVIGSHGEDGPAGMLLGGVGEYCLHRSPCPVAVIHAAGAGLAEPADLPLDQALAVVPRA